MQYLKDNLWRGMRTSPLRAPLRAWMLLPPYALFALVVGFLSGHLHYAPLSGPMVAILPLTMFVFPSLLEEAFFRGVLIPCDTAQRGPREMARSLGLSTFLFVIWHPLNALLVNHSAIPLFTDPWFLLIVTALGVTCGYGYVISRSLWVPVIMHWLTVVIWVLLLGGRNLVLNL